MKTLTEPLSAQLLKSAFRDQIQRTPLQEYQYNFAQAIRHNDPSHLAYPVDERRLAVYCRLVRNNTLGFIDRCFVEAPVHFGVEFWAEIKERFIREGRAHSPFFQDIAGEFLNFCRQQNDVSEALLDLMDFENAQLLAEVAMAKVPSAFDWNNETVMQFSGTAELREYGVDFISTDFQALLPEPSRVVIWRNSRFQVYYRALAHWDYLLLNFIQEQPQSFHDVLNAVSALTENQPELPAVLKQLWNNWVRAEVFYPYENTQ